jgi:hypothetical protein
MNYLENLACRRKKAALKNQAAFGILSGTLMILFGGWNYYLVITELDVLWQGILAIGVVLFSLGIGCPALLQRPYELFNWAGGLVGKAIFTMAISCIYFGLVFPLGLLARWKMERNPFQYWDEKPPCSTVISWEDKSLEEQKYNYLPGRESKLGFYLFFLNVISFFFKKRYIIIIPSLVVLIIIGIMFFFIQGSVLAPFIYTVF